MRLSERLLVMPALCAGLFASPALAALSIEGHVVNTETNEAVPDADVKLTCLTDNARLRRLCTDVSGKTGADGSFRFDKLESFKYRVQALGAPGLVPAKASQLEVDFATSGSVTEAVLRLSPEGSITGKVVDEKGEPKADVRVIALRQTISGAKMQVRVASKTVTNEKGVFTLHSLLSGNYYVATPLDHEDKNDPTNPYLLFAPDLLGLDQATLTHVDTGQSASNVELHMRPLHFFRIQGKAQMETAGSLPTDTPQLAMDARDSSGGALPSRRIPLNPDGTFETEALPGFYTLRLTGAVSVPTAKNSQKPTATIVHLLAKQDIEVSAKDVLGLTLLIPPPITVTGHALLESPAETKLAKGHVILVPVEPGSIGGPQTAEIQPDGTFALTNCDPANYIVRFSPPSGTYVKSITFNQQDALTHLLDLSRGAGGELTIVIKAGPAAITGTLSDLAAARDASGAQTTFDVALISDLWNENGLFPVKHTGSKNGTFSIDGLPPGHYTAIASAGIERGLWENPKFVREMQSRGVGVDLEEQEQKQLSVPYLASDEVEQIRLHLGVN